MMPTFDLTLSHAKEVSSAQVSQENQREQKRQQPGRQQQQRAARGDCQQQREAQEGPAL